MNRDHARDSLTRSSAAFQALAVLSARTMASDGPAGGPGSIWRERSCLAATTHGLPGPTILSHLGTVAVP